MSQNKAQLIDASLESLNNVSGTPTDGQTLIWNATSGQWEPSSIPGVSLALAGLTDVGSDSPSDGQALVWNATAGQWEPGVIPSSTLAALSDVAATAPSDGQALVWNATASQWEPGTVAAPGQEGLNVTQSLLDSLESQFNGATTTFSLLASGEPFTPQSALALEVVLGGVQQEPGSDYTVSGDEITFSTAPVAGLNCTIIGSTYSVGGSGAIVLNDLTDVTAGSPSNGQALVWNATAGQWEPGTVSGGGGVSATTMVAPAQGDPSWSVNACVFHMDGTVGSKTFVDSGPNSISGIFANSGPVISSTRSKFGGTSAYFNSASTIDYIYVSHSSLAMSGDLTWECWIYPEAVDSWRGIICKAEAGADHNLYVNNGALEFVAQTYYPPAIRGGVVSPGNWYHVALVRSAGVFKLYLDGIQVGASASNSATTASAIRIGRDSGSSGWQGYIDEVRISSVARYTQNFTPPTEAFTFTYTPVALPSPAVVGQTVSDGDYLYICTASGAPGTWKKVTLSIL